MNQINIFFSSKGGVAVADYNSVVEGEKIIKTAMDNFSRVDILINNAGILRDKSFGKMTEQVLVPVTYTCRSTSSSGI